MSNTSLSEAELPEETGGLMQAAEAGPEASGQTLAASQSFFLAVPHIRLLWAEVVLLVAVLEEAEQLHHSSPFRLPGAVEVGEMKPPLPFLADREAAPEPTALAVRPPTVQPGTRRARAQARETTVEPDFALLLATSEVAVVEPGPLAETASPELPVAQAAMGRQA